MNVIFCLLFCVLKVLANPEEEKRQTTDPEVLDELLAQKRYEEFSKIMDLGNPELAYPRNEEKTLNELMSNKDLSEGDIVFSSKENEQARQGLDFNRHGSYKWPNGQVPFVISNDYNHNERNFILRSIEAWNRQVQCIKFIPRSNHEDYVFFFNGQGCWSWFGRRGGEQGISLQKVNGGCMYEGVVLHEMEHAIGFHHEHTRSDRDDFVQVIWENIPQGEEHNYEKNNPYWWGLQGNYDYYSVMHYPVIAYNNKRVFNIRRGGIDERRMGTYEGFTQMDLNKISQLYC